MASFCIPKQYVKDLKAHLKMDMLYSMTSKERREFFQKHTNKEIGKKINTEFEKALVSSQKDAMEQWVMKNFLPDKRESAVKKISEMNDLLTPENEEAFLEDLVASKFGVDITPEEAKFVSEKAKEIEVLEKKLGDNVDSPEHAEDTIAYYKAISEMEDYLLDLMPSSKVGVATGVIARANLLASPKSALVNIENNIGTGVAEGIKRRVENGRVSGYNPDLITDYVKMNMGVYHASGYDLSRMISLNEGVALPNKTMGETIDRPKSEAVKAYSKGVFKYWMGEPDVLAASWNFADSANLISSRIAERDFNLTGDAAKKKAREIMMDAMKVTPQTDEGIIVREMARSDAEFSTMSQSRVASDMLLEGRRWLDKISNHFGVKINYGILNEPFVKVPANAVANSLVDYSGLGVTLRSMQGLVRVMKDGGWNGIKNDKLYIRNLVNDGIRGGMGVGLAYLIGSYIEPDNFMGAYDPNRYKIDQLKDSSYNAVKFGDKWISLDYFGVLAAPLVGIMYAKKYGEEGWKSWLPAYGNGLVSQVGRFPVVGTLADTIGEYTNQNEKSLATFLQDKFKDTGKGIYDFVANRTVPAVISDLAKGLDTHERDTKTGEYTISGIPVDSIVAKIPYMRESLPKKTNILGREIETEGLISTLAAGSRVKTDKSTPAEAEVFRLTNAGFKPSLTDFSDSRSEKVAHIRESLSKEDFKKATDEYGELVRNTFDKLIKDPKYQAMSDEDRKNTMDEIATTYLVSVTKKYGFKDTTPKRKNKNAFADKYKAK